MRKIEVAVNEHGHAIGERHHSARWSDETIRLIRNMREVDRATYRAIAETYGVPILYVRDVCRYKRRAQVPHEWIWREVREHPQTATMPQASDSKVDQVAK